MAAWIAHPAEFDAQLARWPQQAAVALDTEFMRIDTYAPRLALIQTRVDGAIALLDAPALGAMAALAEHLARPGVITIMHSASEDLEALAPILPQGIHTLFDTQIAAAFAGVGYGMSYQKLVAELLGIDVPKGETRSDWLKRPLSAAQLEYAAQDVEHLTAVHERLAHQLEALGRSAWLAEDCQRMLDRARNKSDDPQPQLALRAAAGWPMPQQAMLRKLLLWRETTARAIDRPRSWLLDNNVALDLAQTPARDADELKLRTRGQRALRGPQRDALWQLLNTPLDAADLAIPPIPQPPTNAEKRALSAMKEAVLAVAEALVLPESILCSRRHLEALLQTRQWPSSLEGWRKPLLHERLLPLLPG